jgi:hypothetical protein
MSAPDRFLLAGVMGWPVMHSRSPILHNYLFARYGLTGTYVPLAIKPDSLRAALRGLAPLGFSGCNVTIPHKERALSIVDHVDPVARRIGAISCVIVRPDESLAGTNNDAFGFVQNVLQVHPGWCAGCGVQPGRSWRARHSSGESNAPARRKPGPRIRAARVSVRVGRAAYGAGRRGDAGQHDQPGNGRSAAARPHA